MGTRGAFGFHSEKKDKVSYSHYDSYPDGLGQDIMNFIRHETLDSLKEIGARIQMVSSDSKPTPQQINECQNWTDMSVSNQSTNDWYCLLRKSQGNLDAFNHGLNYMLDSNDFLLDSLFCEYAYIINIDNKTLEFYSGFNQMARKRKGRYADKQIDKGRAYEYYGVVLQMKIPLIDIIDADNETISAMIKKMKHKCESFDKRQERELKKQKLHIQVS